MYPPGHDSSSHPTCANAAFAHVSGFNSDEPIGQPHNQVRHPDMPPETFADRWATLKAGQSWTALVKNWHKNGDPYGVRGDTTPCRPPPDRGAGGTGQPTGSGGGHLPGLNRLPSGAATDLQVEVRSQRPCAVAKPRKSLLQVWLATSIWMRSLSSEVRMSVS